MAPAPNPQAAPAHLPQPNDRDQIINFLLARGDERDKTIKDLREMVNVQSNTIAQLQQKIEKASAEATAKS